MPLEIKELHIIAAISEAIGMGEADEWDDDLEQEEREEERTEAIVQLCVEKVMDILKAREER